MKTRYSLLEKLNHIIAKSQDNKDVNIAEIIHVNKETQFTSYKFCADNAYFYIANQVEFGPRVPGSNASIKCAKWIADKLKEFGSVNIKEQHFQAIAYNGNILNSINISAQINSDVKKRILLLAHWDSRPWADCDKDPVNRSKPIDGANDGASGVGVILEILRVFAHHYPMCGIDVLFVDAEDYGQRIDEPYDVYDAYSWCLGTQYWICNPTLPLSNVSFAILLDMVGGKNTIFQREYFSQQSSGYINDMIWQTAKQTGNATYFVEKVSDPIIDDHIYFILNMVPAIAIVGSQGTAFNSTWHTIDDTITNIDLKTIKAIGETLEQFLLLYFAELNIKRDCTVRVFQ